MKQFNLALISAFLVILLQVGFLCAHAADINWRSDIAAAAAEAKSSNRFMFVEISAPWCPACRRLEKLMGNNKIGEWTNPRFVSVHLSADAPGGKALMNKFGIRGISALLVFAPDGKFKDKMSGGPSDVDGFKYFLTKMAGGEAALANVGNASGGNSSFSPQTEPWPGNGTAGGAYPTPQDSYPQGNYDQAPQQMYSSTAQQGFQSPPQQGFQSPPQQGFQNQPQAYQSPTPQNYLPPSQQNYQPPQQGFQSPPQQNYLPPAQYPQGSYPQGNPQGQMQTGYSNAPPNGFAPQQQFSQPVMQWQGQQPPNLLFPAQYSQPQQQFQQQPGQIQQPGFQQPGQFQQPAQQYQQPPLQFQQPAQQYPHQTQQSQTQYAPPAPPVQQQQR